MDIDEFVSNESIISALHLNGRAIGNFAPNDSAILKSLIVG